MTWKRLFTNFLLESGASREGVPWEAKWAAFESCVTAQTFKKIEALRRQLPVDDHEKVGSILAAVTKVAQATANLWIHRHKFNECYKKSNQPFKLFCSELVILSSLCKHDKELCDADKQKLIDLLLLNKIIFSIQDRAAQNKLFEEKKLNLTKAIKIIEAYEEIQKTEETFASQTVKNMINEEFSSTISRAQDFAIKRKISERKKYQRNRRDCSGNQTIGSSNAQAAGINLTHTERARLKESNVTIVAGKAILKKRASRKISVSHQKALTRLFPTSARRPNKLASTCARMQGEVMRSNLSLTRVPTGP